VTTVIGANDVTNPAARNEASSLIYAMPILNVDKSRSVIVLKRSMSSGFAGIDNPLFYAEGTAMLFGDVRNRSPRSPRNSRRSREKTTHPAAPHPSHLGGDAGCGEAVRQVNQGGPASTACATTGADLVTVRPPQDACGRQTQPGSYGFAVLTLGCKSLRHYDFSRRSLATRSDRLLGQSPTIACAATRLPVTAVIHESGLVDRRACTGLHRPSAPKYANPNHFETQDESGSRTIWHLGTSPMPGLPRPDTQLPAAGDADLVSSAKELENGSLPDR
jgi:hypothetical protein